MNFNLRLVLHRPPLFLTLGGQVRCYTLIMSSHAPGEGGKNAPMQITEGPSIAVQSNYHRSDPHSHFSRQPRLPTRRLFFILIFVSGRPLWTSCHWRTAEAALYDRQIRLWGLEAQQRHVPSPICLSALTMVILGV